MKLKKKVNFLKEAKDLNIALITGGAPLIATTHGDFIVEAVKRGINYEIIHGSSILSSAPAISGLQGFINLVSNYYSFSRS